jgi:hypothetical protein
MTCFFRLDLNRNQSHARKLYFPQRNDDREAQDEFWRKPKTVLLEQCDPGSDFSFIFSAENSAENFPPKKLEKLEFSAEKVLKNRFSNKFHGKKCTKNWPQEPILRS